MRFGGVIGQAMRGGITPTVTPAGPASPQSAPVPFGSWNRVDHTKAGAGNWTAGVNAGNVFETINYRMQERPENLQIYRTGIMKGKNIGDVIEQNGFTREQVMQAVMNGNLQQLGTGAKNVALTLEDWRNREVTRRKKKTNSPAGLIGRVVGTALGAATGVPGGAFIGGQAGSGFGSMFS